MFTKVLVANRGEIAVRVIRTLRLLGIGSVAVYSDADAGARHVREADEAIRLGPAPPTESYLHIGRMLAAADRSGAQAVHPGYGFLAENAAFARACGNAGLVFIGPPPGTIEAMGDKIRAKATVAAAGVPVVPGAGQPGMTDAELTAAAAGVGFPLLIKPSAGGGGKGMRLVRSAASLGEAYAGARREARAAFGDDTLLLERYIERPRHIEIQVLADTHGTTVHLGERECSLQRRHQKVIEEAPSPLLDEARRTAMGSAAVRTARSVGYAGAGTVEFIVPGDRPGDFYFLEMNTRLQVEHPVTELVTGLDLVELQIRVAAGEPLPFGQDDVRLSGHAVEARLYAEDPSRGFLPTGGTVLALREPGGPFVRIDSGLAPGMTVTSSYDPMLAKVAAWGADRDTALRRLDAALAGTTVLGVSTNLAFLRALIGQPGVAAGDLDTGLIERHLSQLTAADVPDEVLAAAALARLLAREPAGPVTDPWDIPDGWRPSEPAWTRLRLTCAPRETAEVRVRGRAGVAAEVAVGDAEPVPARAERHDGELVLTIGGRTVRYAFAEQSGPPGGGLLWLGRDGHAWAVREEPRLTARAAETRATDGIVASPMPGTVLAVNITKGQGVAFGQPLLIVEAMKMEHTVTAPFDGTIAELAAKTGQQVAMDETLAVVHAGEQAG
jgi:acetyl-CoA/propionyl-CoA carboxylase, biotin carboxylase, biotin carboxyl carrier protein